MYNENFNNNMVTIINIMFSMNRTNPFIEIYLKQASNAEIHNTIWLCNSNYNSIKKKKKKNLVFHSIMILFMRMHEMIIQCSYVSTND